MATAWLFTLPAAGLVGALSYWIADGIGGNAGAAAVLVLLVGVAGLIYFKSRATAVSHDNVNSEWTGSVAPAQREKELTAK
jgi:PiT family inorganic phosphate transporter